ncbi:restriction endonuclease subunit S [Streptococcus infantis]|uniref:restriction endonuclease subunit S n=1 Tax=Streptococcus infantis TaxID=68892 RepID=UPI001CC047F2|nr:restriction endonuclease subunit S [Streptococcus infantis]MBZ2117673.1 restriction endonuclease subunit S [Streptococcus infantis]
MSEFKTYTLDQLCIVGSSKRVHLSDYVQQGIPFYRSKEVIELSSGKNISEQLFISSEKYSEIKSKFPVPQENDVLITAVGTIGEILVVKDPNFYFKDGNLIWLRNINFEIIDIDYLYYFLKSDLFQKTIKYNNIGAVQKALTIDFLKTVKITLPSLDNQRKLISVLKSIDKKLRINNQINQELEAMAKTLYDYWFVQFDFPDQNGKPYKSSGGKMVYNPELKREIPEGWGVEKLGELAQFKNGINYEKTSSGSEKVKIINVRNISSSTIFINQTDLDEIFLENDKSTNFIVNEGMILITRSGIPGATRLVSELEAKTVYSGFIIASEVNDLIYKNLIFYYLKHVEEVLKNQSAGTIMKNISQSVLTDMTVSLPPQNVLLKFNSIVDNLLEQMKNVQRQNQELTQLRDWLLPMLMNGQVKVE